MFCPPEVRSTRTRISGSVSAPDLRNMATLTEAGATIIPASPSFYNKPKTITEVVDTIVARVLDHLGIEHTLVKRWQSSE